MVVRVGLMGSLWLDWESVSLGLGRSSSLLAVSESVLKKTDLLLLLFSFISIAYGAQSDRIEVTHRVRLYASREGITTDHSIIIR